GGTADRNRQAADILDQLQQSMVDAYSRKTGIPQDEISKMIDEETWLDASPAEAVGFVDRVSEPLAMAAEAKFDVATLKNFKKTPATRVATLQQPESAVWTTAYINNLSDSAFLYVESGGKKDSQGKTTPRSLRHFPYKDSSGKIDL